MEDIKEGEYIRTEKGTIAKITDIEWDLLYEILSKKPKYKHWVSDKQCYTEYITKHSPNIIDLIEIGDYVNDYKVIKIDWYEPITDKLQKYVQVESNKMINIFYADTIKSIVTKERFKSMEYIVKEV